MEQSAELTAFYRAYRDWVDAGASTPEFKQYEGLCLNLRNFLCLDYYDKDTKFCIELKTQFKDAGLSKNYPFGMFEYFQCFKTSAMHKDKNRLSWVRSHCRD